MYAHNALTVRVHFSLNSMEKSVNILHVTQYMLHFDIHSIILFGKQVVIRHYPWNVSYLNTYILLYLQNNYNFAYLIYFMYIFHRYSIDFFIWLACSIHYFIEYFDLNFEY